MADVFRDCILTWGGKDYTFTPSMRLLRLIERGDGNGPVSIVSLMTEAMRGKPQISFMAWLVHTVMTYAGARCSEDEIYRDMMANNEDAVALYNGIIAAISPAEAEEKKDEAPAE